MTTAKAAIGVVVALLDGTRKKGFVYDLRLERGEFHLYFSRDMSDADAEVIELERCKAVYFVKSLTGNPDYKENKTDLRGKTGFGKPFEVIFSDGEVMRGTVESYNKDRIGFYMVPPDPNSNSERIYVVQANARAVTQLTTFGKDDPNAQWETPDPVRYPADMRADLVMRIIRGKKLDVLAEESYLPSAVLAHWREKFLEGGVAALLRDDPAPADAEAGGGRRKAFRFPPKKRVEAVLRVLLHEDASVVSQVFLAPLQVMSEWHERFLAAGRERLAVLAGNERGQSPEDLRTHYEGVVRAWVPGVETAESLMELLIREDDRSAQPGADAPATDAPLAPPPPPPPPLPPPTEAAPPAPPPEERPPAAPKDGDDSWMN